MKTYTSKEVKKILRVSPKTSLIDVKQTEIKFKKVGRNQWVTNWMPCNFKTQPLSCPKCGYAFGMEG